MLVFSEQCRHYFARHLHLLSVQDLAFIFDTAARIRGGSHNYFVAVPAHCRERSLARFLDLVLPQISKVGATLIIFWNARNDSVSSPEFCETVREAEEAIAAARAKFGYANVILAKRLFDGDQVGMGPIRGLLCDIVLIAALDSNAARPFVTFLDIDTLQIGPEFFEAILTKFSLNHFTSMLSGPIHHGYIGSDPHSSLGGQDVPELFIYNEIEAAVKLCGLAGQINFEKRLWWSGAHMSFSLATYCACGGFDFRRTSGEDDALGRALHRFNPGAYHPGVVSEDDVFTPDEEFGHAYESDSWLVSDPRRVLSTIAGGGYGVDTWAHRPFMRTIGSQFSSSELARICDQNASLLTSQRLRSALVDGSESDVRFLYKRLLDILYHSFVYDERMRTSSHLMAAYSKVGIRFAKSAPDLLNVEDVDWSRSSIIEQLARIASRA